MQINLTGFLNGKNARLFMAALWQHLISAQQNEMGVPTAFVEAKKAELEKEKQAQVQVYCSHYILPSWRSGGL